MVYDSTEGRWENSVPPLSQESAWMMCHLARLTAVLPLKGWQGLISPFLLPQLPPAFPISLHDHLHGGCCLGDEPGWSCSSSVALSQTCPHPCESQWVLRSAASSGAKAEVSQGEGSRTKGRWQALSASQQCLPSPLQLGTGEPVRNAGIASVRSDCPSQLSPSLIPFNRIKTQKRAPEAGRIHIVGGLFPQSCYFPLYGELYSCLKDLNNGLSAMNGAAVLWCLAHQSNFFESAFTSLIKTTLWGIQQLQRTCGSAHPPGALTAVYELLLKWWFCFHYQINRGFLFWISQTLFSCLKFLIPIHAQCIYTHTWILTYMCIYRYIETHIYIVLLYI